MERGRRRAGGRGCSFRPERTLFLQMKRFWTKMIDPAKLEPIVFDPVNNAYLKLGEKVGNAFQDGMKLK